MSRRCFVCLAGSLVGLSATVLALSLYLSTGAPRAQLELVEMGMNREEATSLLASVREADWEDNFPTVGEVWEMRDGKVSYVRWEPPTKVYMLVRHSRKDCLSKSTNRGIIFVDFDADQRVIGKTWLEYSRPGPFEWIKRWW